MDHCDSSVLLTFRAYDLQFKENSDQTRRTKKIKYIDKSGAMDGFLVSDKELYKRKNKNQMIKPT